MGKKVGKNEGSFESGINLRTRRYQIDDERGSK
jgi:hypothetical protein